MRFDPELFHECVVTAQTGPSSFVVPRRYTQLSFISAGAQGTVVKAYDTVKDKHVAIKKVHNPFLTPMNAKRTYREFVLLATMHHVNLIQLEHAFSPQKSLDNFEEIYLVMELMDYNLHQLIRLMKINHTNLSFFTYQMVVAMNYMHRSGIIHRDLKPSNIVVGQTCVLKILDYGLARKIETNERMSMYVVTRHYRAPEVILGLPYTEKVDVWAIGCILAEMITRRILFPGTDRLDQWTKITDILGTPSKAFIDRLDYHAKLFVKSKGRMHPKPMAELFPDNLFVEERPDVPALNANNARDLLSKMLQLDPDDRISIAEAVKHPYISMWFRREEWDTPLPENRYNPETDLVEKPIEDWKAMLFEEVKLFETRHPVFQTQV